MATVWGVTCIVPFSKESSSVDKESLLVIEFLTAYRDLRRACPKGDLRIHLFVEGSREEVGIVEGVIEHEKDKKDPMAQEVRPRAPEPVPHAQAVRAEEHVGTTAHAAGGGASKVSEGDIVRRYGRERPMIIEGEYDEELGLFGEVRVGGAPLDPKPSQEVWNHSPDGFAWSYGGSGPSQLALAVLLAAGVRPSLAVALHQRFKAKYIAPLPRKSFRIEVDVEAFVREQEPLVGVPSPSTVEFE